MNKDLKKLKLNEYKIFNFDGREYILVVESAAIFEMGSEFKEIVDFENGYIDLSKYSGNSDELMNSLKKTLLVSEDLEKGLSYSDTKHSHSINSIVLMLSQACNLRCKYCYAGDGEYKDKGFMTKEVAKKAIDFLFKESSRNRVHIVLFGGEPLLNFPVFKFCVEYAKLKSKETNIEVSFSTTTNGTMMNAEVANFLLDNEFGITISVDGDRKTHDVNRVNKYGEGTYDKIIKDINRFFTTGRVGVRATITAANTSINDIYNHLYSLGFGSIRMSTSINSMTRNDYTKLLESNKKMISEFKKSLEEGDIEKCLKNSNIMSILNRLYEGGVRKKFCGAGNNLVAIDKQGDIYACHRLVDVKDSSYGNIIDGYDVKKKDSFLDILSNTHKYEDCFKCWAKSICGGGCPAENHFSNDSFVLPHSETCEIYRNLIVELFKMYVDFSEQEREMLFAT